MTQTKAKPAADAPLVGIPSNRAIPFCHISTDRYTSRQFHELEVKHLWSHVWQMACREEEIPNPGSFLVYDNLDDSIIIVRQPDLTLKAFFNACRHRGLQLVQGLGQVTEFQCPFHAWTYRLDGSLDSLLSPDEFPCGATYSLAECAVDSWGGFVFINVDPTPQPLVDYLRPLSDVLARYHYESMVTTRWNTAPFPCNWKHALESFMEVYHFAGTHPQTLCYSPDTAAWQNLLGIHSETVIPGYFPSARVGEVDSDAVIAALIEGYQDFGMENMGGFAVEDLALPEGISVFDFLPLMVRQVAEVRGVDLSEFPDDKITEFHITTAFPNVCIQAVSPSEALIWRMRPNGHDPDSCLVDEIVLTVPTPTEGERAAERRYKANWRDFNPGLALRQDYENLEIAQRGLKQRTHLGNLTAAEQESRIPHLHAAIDRYITGDLC